MSDVESRHAWHLDRRVPVAIIITIMLQIAAGVWSVAGLYARVDNIEEKVGGLGGVKERLAASDAERRAIRDQLGRIERKMDRILDRLPPASGSYRTRSLPQASPPRQ